MNRLGLILVSAWLFTAAACSNDTNANGTDAAVDSGAGSDGGTDAAADAGATACSAYCDDVTANCVEGNTQYADNDACLAACTTNNKWPAGTPGAASGNSLACRVYHATNTASDATTHCAHAGPTGGSVCGSLCEAYCSLALQNCTGDNEIFADEAECMTACEEYATDGEVGAMSGNHVQCRIYHLGAAGANSNAAITHCPHGAEDGGGVCVNA